jgi:tRNA dimethylallyltransferase
MTSGPRVAALVGPTAAGKSELAVTVAERLGGEIVSVDSMQIYRGMDIGTAKPDAELRGRVRHHLLDLFPVSHDLTVAEYQALGRAAIDDIVTRGRLPLLVGGSGLYYRAIVDDFEFPPRNDEVRARLEADAERVGPGALHDRLRAVDAVAATKIDPANVRRTVRALEVVELTGRPFSEGATVWHRYESRYQLKAAGIARERAELRARIAARVDGMLAAGLIEEVKAVAGEGISRTARQALGYRQVLEADSVNDVGALRSEIVQATVRFARRQESWFNSDKRINWFDPARPDIVAALCSHFEG